MSKYDDMRDFYTKELDNVKNVNERHYDRLLETQCKLSAYKTKVEVYEKLLSKSLGDSNKCDDKVFVLDGKVYKMTEYTLQHNNDQADNLTVEFVHIFDFGKGDKT